MGPSTNELSALKAELDALRPLTELQLQRLWPQWASEDALFVYATNAIEGSTMTLAETTVVLESGITIGGKTVQEHLDILNGQQAYQLMLEVARSKKSIDVDVIFALHRAIVGDQAWAGRWRTEPVYIRGSMHVPPNWVKVARLMEEALARFAVSVRTEHPVVAASTLHFDLLTVHPFQDGNGRTARLLQNLHHIATGYAPVLIEPSEKANYLSVVQKTQIAIPGIGDRTDFVAYVVGLEFRALERYMRSLEIAYGPEREKSESIQLPDEARNESQTRRRR
jgi:Fic family protein